MNIKLGVFHEWVSWIEQLLPYHVINILDIRLLNCMKYEKLC